MKIIQTTVLTLEEKQCLFKLWNFEYPDKIVYSKISEFEDYLEKLSNQKHYLLINELNEILGWSFTFLRDNDNWFAIILNSNIHRKGYGTTLLQELKKNSLVLNGWVIDHQNEIKQNKETYISPLDFYTKNGFLVNQDVRIENDKISAVKIRWKKE
ncbi:hypothetical protein [Flavobacterium sp. 5]|uniref:hypothetical protein n=1 Tax=Flavobacterium sp. 5 TaxID=2035199 RepID=UPI000C2C7302|nr:hypothetical protein [Flavobacterium sp. 5]PKB16719.1 hypothetical protein CLU82_1864 [Flavobacterium sp. 5]